MISVIYLGSFRKSVSQQPLYRQWTSLQNFLKHWLAFGKSVFLLLRKCLYYDILKEKYNMEASMAELTPLTWTFVREYPVPADINDILLPGEEPKAAYATIRDSAIFTNRRLIVRDAQGLTGKKVEMYSLPYSSINMWSTENAGKFLDFNAEVELWTRAGHIKINLKKGIDIRRFDRLIAEAIL